VVDIPVPHHHQEQFPVEHARLVPSVARLLIVENDLALRQTLSATFASAPDIDIVGSITASDSTASTAHALHADTVSRTRTTTSARQARPATTISVTERQLFTRGGRHFSYLSSERLRYPSESALV